MVEKLDWRVMRKEGRDCGCWRDLPLKFTRAIDSIRDEHAVLGRHLQNSISSGLTFRYDPERDPNWLT